MSIRRDVIESIDGGVVHYNAEEDDEADAFNADTFGDDVLEEYQPSAAQSGFFDIPEPAPKATPKKAQRPSPPKILPKSPLEMLFQHTGIDLDGSSAPDAPPGLMIDYRGTVRGVPRKVPGGPAVASPIDSLFQQLGVQKPVTAIPPPPPLPSPPSVTAAPELLNITTRFGGIPLSAPPPPPPPPPPPVAMDFGDDGTPRMSIHAVPVRVLPTPFTALQGEQALNGRLDQRKWGRQGMSISYAGLMTQRDKEFVTKIQLNQMVALCGNSVQNYRGQFTFGRTSGSVSNVDRSEESWTSDPDALGKRMYSSVYHPRKLVDLVAAAAASSAAPAKNKQKTIAAIVEKCFDLILDVVDVDECISTLHPLAEQKIAQAVTERTAVMQRVIEVLKELDREGPGNNTKAVLVKKRAIDCIVEFLQPQQTASDAEARRALIFRRVPESVQALYIDMLEQIVGSE